MRGTTAPRLHLELMCARVLLPGADVDERGIHARLDRLERRLGVAGSGSLPGPAEPAARPTPAVSRSSTVDQEPDAEPAATAAASGPLTRAAAPAAAPE